MKKTIFFTLGLICIHFCLYAVPYFSEHHENHFIIVFKGEISEKDIPKIRALERRYVEEMTTLSQSDMNIGKELEDLGITIEVMMDAPNVKPPKYPILPESS